MDINLKKSQERTLVLSVIILVFMTILSIGFNYKLYSDYKEVIAHLVNNKQVIIKPMVNADEEFSFMGERGDAHYLRLIGLSFIGLRLDVNAQTVTASHEILTGYLSEGLREKLIPVLSQEKQRLKINNGNSVFYPESIRVSPSNGIFDIKGKLEFSYGLEKTEKIPKHYQLRIDTRNGQLKLNDFVEIEK